LNLSYKQFYKGAYIKELAEKCFENFKNIFDSPKLSKDEELQIVNFAIENLVNQSLKTLEDSGINFDQITYETSIVEKKLLPEIIKELENKDLVYHGQLHDPKDFQGTKKDNEITIFKSTNFGDDEDRAITKNDGTPTYFANDIVYHVDKYQRKFSKLINIWGADHHGYIPRVKASIESLGLDSKKLKTLLIQFVSLKEKGQKVQMSTRSGEFVELSDLVDEVGIDSARYYFLARKPEQALEFDIDLAKKTNKDNHVYYIQYAHARICSIKKELKKRKIDFNLKESLEKLSLLKETEKEIISLVNGYPEILEQCYKNNELHPLCFYLRDLSSKFHSFYNAEKIISDDKDYSDAKIALSIAIKEIINNGLNILGIGCPEKM